MKGLRRAIAAAVLAGFSGRVLLPALALAEEAGGEHGGKGGLPQFDPSSWSSQIFWLLIMFAVLYLFFSRRTLPEISGTIENRRDHVQSDLNSAARLTREAESVQQAYEESLEKARIESARIISGVEEDMKSAAAQAVEDFQERSAKDIRVAETRIGKAQQEAMTSMSGIVAEVAGLAAEKLSGMKVDAGQVQEIVRALEDKAAGKARAA